MINGPPKRSSLWLIVTASGIRAIKTVLVMINSTGTLIAVPGAKCLIAMKPYASRTRVPKLARIIHIKDSRRSLARSLEVWSSDKFVVNNCYRSLTELYDIANNAAQARPMSSYTATSVEIMRASWRFSCDSSIPLNTSATTILFSGSTNPTDEK